MADVRVNLHVILVPEDERVVTVPADPGRALLVLPSRESAESFARTVGGMARAVSPEEITAACEHHGLVLIACYGFFAPDELEILTVEGIPYIFEEAHDQ
jgi:hypothetical protein